MPNTQAQVLAMQMAHATPWATSLHSFWHIVELASLCFTSAKSSWTKRRGVWWCEWEKDKLRGEKNNNNRVTSVNKCVHMYLDLGADIFRHEFDRSFLDDFEVPGAEDLHGQDTLRFVNSEALAKWLRHALVRLNIKRHFVTGQNLRQIHLNNWCLEGACELYL